MLISKIFVALFIGVLFLIQTSLLPATNTFLSSINILVITVIWLSYIGSKWSLFIAFVGGLLLDIQLNLMGVNLLSFLLLITFIYFFKKKFITSDRFTYFISLSIISLCYLIILEVVWSWIFIGLFEGWNLVNRSEIKTLFHFDNIWQFVFINFVFLAIIYLLFKKRFSLSLWYEKTT